MEEAVEAAYESDERELKRKGRTEEEEDREITFEGERDDDHNEKRRRLMIMRELTQDRKWKHKDARMALRALADCKAEPWKRDEIKAMHDLENNDLWFGNRKGIRSQGYR